MTDQTEIEKLFTAIHDLTEHNTELQEQIIKQSEANIKQQEDTAKLFEKLEGQLKQYQDKEYQIIGNTNQHIAKNINDAFRQNAKSYESLTNKRFTTHIEEAAKELSTVSTNIEQQFKDLEKAANNSKTEFESREEFFKLQEDTYDIQSRKLKESVNKTLTQVSKDTEDKLSDLGDHFTASLTWKMTGMLVTICLCLLLITFGIAWLFIPSKADIAERKANYLELERYQLADNIGNGKDGYYADVIQSTCFKAKDGKTWCKFR